MDSISELRRIAESKLNIPAKLHDYQWEGIEFLYRSKSALLADEMGLGKTVQTAVALSLLLNGDNNIRRALIVAPSPLTINWVEEIEKWAPSLATRRISGNTRSREAYYLLPIPVLVGSYEQIRSDGLDRIPINTFDIVILDEAQRIKNKKSSTSLACRLLSRERSWALSATPLENEESDIVSILSFIDPSTEMGLSHFRLMEKLESLMLRRRKSEVRAELPPVLIQDLRIELSQKQRERYDELWTGRVKDIREGTTKQDIGASLLGLITQLKTLCNFDSSTNSSSKLEVLKTIIEGAGTDAKIIVFSQFVTTLRWISERIDTPHDLLIGSMSLDERSVVMNKFQTGKSPRLLLISLRAGGVGLNLGSATHVVLFDRWWNPAVEVQAIYRAHRFNREEPLHVVRFLVNDSIEDRIDDILRTKERLFGEVVDGPPQTQTPRYQFTRRELMQVLDIANEEVFEHYEG
ncbi:MAG: DEAD/DEAH box helicase [Thermodesulfobacteriota bacterium]